MNNWPWAVQQIWTDSNTKHQHTTGTLKQDPTRQNTKAEINLIEDWSLHKHLYYMKMMKAKYVHKLLQCGHTFCKHFLRGTHWIFYLVMRRKSLISSIKTSMASLSLFYRTARLFALLSSLEFIVNKAIISLCLVIISSVYCSVADMIPFQHHLTLNPATFNFSRQSHYFCSFTYSWRTSFSLYVSSVKAYHRGLGDLMEEQMSPGKSSLPSINTFLHRRE